MGHMRRTLLSSQNDNDELMIMIMLMTPGPLHMPSLLRLHRLPPSQAALPFWPLLGWYQVSNYHVDGIRIWLSYSTFKLQGNTAHTRTRQSVVQWHQPLPHLPPQHHLTRNTSWQNISCPNISCPKFLGKIFLPKIFLVQIFFDKYFLSN